MLGTQSALIACLTASGASLQLASALGVSSSRILPLLGSAYHATPAQAACVRDMATTDCVVPSERKGCVSLRIAPRRAASFLVPQSQPSTSRTAFYFNVQPTLSACTDCAETWASQRPRQHRATPIADPLAQLAYMRGMSTQAGDVPDTTPPRRLSMYQRFKRFLWGEAAVKFPQPPRPKRLTVRQRLSFNCWIERSLLRSGLAIANDVDFARLAARTISVSTYVVVGLAALGTAGVDVQPIVTTLGVGGVAIGFALRDVATNIVAGALMVVSKSFTRGDRLRVFVGSNQLEGRVEAIELRHVILSDAGGARLLIPSSVVYTSPVQVFPQLAAGAYTGPIPPPTPPSPGVVKSGGGGPSGRPGGKGSGPDNSDHSHDHPPPEHSLSHH